MSLESEFIRWPVGDGKREVMTAIEQKHGFKNCLGFIDGTTFELMHAPKTNPECYFSRKSEYCLSAQLVCDHKRRVSFYQVRYFTMIFVPRHYILMCIIFVL